MVVVEANLLVAKVHTPCSCTQELGFVEVNLNDLPGGGRIAQWVVCRAGYRYRRPYRFFPGNFGSYRFFCTGVPCCILQYVMLSLADQSLVFLTITNAL